MISENSTAKTQARAFSFFAFSGNLGIFLGPMIGMLDVLVSNLLEIKTDIYGHEGGALAKPATVFPSIFGHVQFFHDFPYALPTIVTGGIGAIATISSGIFIKEVCVPLVSP